MWQLICCRSCQKLDALIEVRESIDRNGNFRGAGKMTFYNIEDVGTCAFLPSYDSVDSDLSGDEDDAAPTHNAAADEPAMNHAVQHQLAPPASTFNTLRNGHSGSASPQTFPAFANRHNTGRRLNRLWHIPHSGTSVSQGRRGSTPTLSNNVEDGAPDQLGTVRELLELTNISSH
jgi:hypothetical protein